MCRALVRGVAGAMAVIASSTGWAAPNVPKDAAESVSASLDSGRQLFHGVASTNQSGAAARPTRYLFNAASCDGCHRDGARGEAPASDGPVPAALVIELET